MPGTYHIPYLSELLEDPWRLQHTSEPPAGLSHIITVDLGS